MNTMDATTIYACFTTIICVCLFGWYIIGRMITHCDNRQYKLDFKNMNQETITNIIQELASDPDRLKKIACGITLGNMDAYSQVIKTLDFSLDFEQKSDGYTKMDGVFTVEGKKTIILTIHALKNPDDLGINVSSRLLMN